MVRLLTFLLFPTWLWVLPLAAPTHMLIDVRPAVKARLIATQSRFEKCSKWNNPGCLKFARQPGAVRLPNGYARFSSLDNGYSALSVWWDRHGCRPVEKALRRYNPQREDYAAVILASAQVRGDEVLGLCR